MRLAVDLNLRHQRRNGVDRIRHLIALDDLKPRIAQSRLHSFADGPDLRIPRQAVQLLDRVVGDDIVDMSFFLTVFSQADDAGGIDTAALSRTQGSQAPSFTPRVNSPLGELSSC